MTGNDKKKKKQDTTVKFLVCKNEPEPEHLGKNVTCFY